MARTSIRLALLGAAIPIAAACGNIVGGFEFVGSGSGAGRGGRHGSGDGGSATTSPTSVDGGTPASSAAGAPACPGGAAACTVVSDCPAPSSDCVVGVCVAGCCATSVVAAGEACTSSGGTLCDGAGSCVACLLATDCPLTTTSCASPACVSNACTTAPAAPGTSCSDSGGTLCDGMGHCVACLSQADCPGGEICLVNTCISLPGSFSSGP